MSYSLRNSQPVKIANDSNQLRTVSPPQQSNAQSLSNSNEDLSALWFLELLMRPA